VMGGGGGASQLVQQRAKARACCLPSSVRARVCAGLLYAYTQFGDGTGGECVPSKHATKGRFIDESFILRVGADMGVGRPTLTVPRPHRPRPRPRPPPPPPSHPSSRNPCPAIGLLVISAALWAVRFVHAQHRSRL
jgi:hypothetical protein